MSAAPHAAIETCCHANLFARLLIMPGTISWHEVSVWQAPNEASSVQAGCRHGRAGHGKTQEQRQAGRARARLEVVEGEGGVVREERRQLVQPDEHHEGHRVALGGHGDQVRAAARHHAAIRQQRVRAHQHLIRPDAWAVSTQAWLLSRWLEQPLAGMSACHSPWQLCAKRTGAAFDQGGPGCACLGMPHTTACLHVGLCAPGGMSGVRAHLVDARHHGEDGGVRNGGRVHAARSQPARQFMATVARRALRHNHLHRG